MSDKLKRRFARARERIPIHLSYDDGDRSFEATVHSTDISVSGVFLSSSFFLRTGMELELAFYVPNDERQVRTRGVIVREVRLDEDTGKSESGFAIHFTRYYDDTKTVLAQSFLIVELDDFVRDYLSRRTKVPRSEADLLTEVIVAWEVGKIDLDEDRANLLREGIRTNRDGRIARKTEKPRVTQTRIAMPETHETRHAPGEAKAKVEKRLQEESYQEGRHEEEADAQTLSALLAMSA